MIFFAAKMMGGSDRFLSHIHSWAYRCMVGAPFSFVGASFGPFEFHFESFKSGFVLLSKPKHGQPSWRIG
jgi:hypothetical protein